MAAGLISSLIGAGGSLVGGILNSIGQKQTNQQNAELAREQMQWSENMMDKQNQWNLEQWNRENEYESYANDLQRWKDAGLNPLFYSGSGGDASSMTSASPLGYERASVQNPLAGVGQAVSNSAIVAADIKSKEYDNKLKEQSIDNMRTDQIYKELQTKQSIEMFGLELESKGLSNRETAMRIQSIEKNMEKVDTDIQTALQKLDIDKRAQYLNEITFEYSKWLNAQNLSIKDKEIAVSLLNYEVNKLLADSQIDLNSEHINGIKLDNLGKVVDVDIKEATKETSIKSAKVSVWTGIARDATVSIGSVAGAVLGLSKLGKAGKAVTRAAATSFNSPLSKAHKVSTTRFPEY